MLNILLFIIYLILVAIALTVIFITLATNKGEDVYSDEVQEKYVDLISYSTIIIGILTYLFLK